MTDDIPLSSKLGFNQDFLSLLTAYQKKRKIMSFIFYVGITFLFCFPLINPAYTYAQIDSAIGEDGIENIRSLESLRDLDYQTWQLVVYKQQQVDENTVLRIVGYPGKLRIDHPQSLNVEAGRKTWQLKDITLKNVKLASDPRAAAAEFDLEPVLSDLINNKPLRLSLSGFINELPVPPYVVKEWRSLSNFSSLP